MDMKGVFAGLRGAAHKMYDFHERAMCAAIKMNMHGMKRFHRHASKEYFCAYMHLANDSGNYMNGECASGEYPHVSFSPATKGIQGYMDAIIPQMEGFVQELTALNNNFVDLAGVDLECATKLQRCAYQRLAKIRRVNQRFKDNGYAPHDIYVADSRLHDKMKGIESSGE